MGSNKERKDERKGREGNWMELKKLEGEGRRIKEIEKG